MVPVLGPAVLEVRPSVVPEDVLTVFVLEQ